MPPKKVQEPEKKPLIGRVGTNLKVGIVGVPNVGKSTFFNVLTKSAAAAENFPFCTIDPNENKQALKSNFDNMIDFYLRSPSDLSNYSNDQSIIVKKKYLKHLSRIKYKEEEPFNLPQILDWYPLANSYYAYTEDVDAYARVNHLLSTKPSFESFTSIARCQNIYEDNVYSEKEAQIQYLSSNPISFLILGKSGIGEQELGKLLANFWKCVYIDPESLITEEILSDSRAGQCIEFNLRSGRAIGVDVIMRLMEKRVKSKSAQHRGFVICGFPLLPNDLYEEDPLSSESAVFNVREIFDEVLDITIEIGIPPPTKPKTSKASKIHFEDAEDEEPPDAEEEVPPSAGTTVKLPLGDEVPLDIGSATMSNICIHGEYEKNFEEQIDFIFSQFPAQFVLIYMMCSNSDVISKRKDCCFDYFSKQMIDLQREHSDKMVYTVFSRESSENETPDDIIDVVKNNTMGLDTSSPRQLVRLPRDFPANVASLLDRYRYFALPVIERHVLIHNREYLIKVDGRISPVRMFNAIKLRLRVLPLQKVVIPEKLLKAAEPGLEGGAAEELDIEGLSHAECFEIFKRKQIASTMFKWSWSDWGIKCPVSMSEGNYLDGNPKWAVHFMNKIFFLTDQDAYLKFYRNPRPYLLPPYPKPSCKIFVVGPRCSGRSAVARCLAYLLRGEVLDFQALEKKFLKLKQNEYLEKIHSAALHEGVVLLDQNRLTERENAEIDRQLKVDEWVEQTKVALEDTMKIIHKYPMTKIIQVSSRGAEAEEEELQQEWLQEELQPEEEEEPHQAVLEISSFPIALIKASKHTSVEYRESKTTLTSSGSVEITDTLDRFRSLIDIEGLHVTTLIELCKELVDDDTKIVEKLPPDLQPPIDDTIEPATIFDDFVKDYANDAVANASLDHIHLTLDHTAEMMIETINQVEEKSELLGDGKGGWIVDGVPTQSELFEKILEIHTPQDIFVLKDEPEHAFLLERFETKGLNLFRDFRRFFMDIGKTDAAWRSPSLHSTASYKTRTIKDIIADVLDESFFVSEQNIAVPSPEEESDPYFRKHPRRSAVEAYSKDLIQFDQDWETLLPILSQYTINIVELIVTNKSFYVLLKELIKGIDDRYRQLPTVFTDDDKLEEIQDFGEPEMLGEELGEAEEQGSSEDGFFQNRRFGDTFNYCPVTFHNNYVLWRGKEDYTVKFEDKLYLLSSETAMGEFLEDPRKYLVGNEPPDTFPPPRICVVGVNGIGKTTVCKALHKNIGVYYKSLDIIFKNFLAPKSKFDVNDIIKMGISGAKGEIIEKYLSSGEPIVEQIWNDLITPLWLENPLKTFGFVFDGFPKRPSDVEYMIQRGIVPDIIVEMVMNETELYNRLTEKFVEDWEIMQEKKHELIKKQRLEIMTAWKETCEVRFNELLEKIKEQRYLAEMAAYEEEMPDSDKPKSQTSFNSAADEEDIEMVNNILLEEIPQPVFEEEPEENLEEAVVKFSTNLEESFQRETEFLRVAREQCDTELIPWVTIDAGMAEDKVFAQLMRVVDKYKFRNDSIFERVYVISVDLADRLLSNGYYFLSKFGKTCPVQIYEKINPIQMFIPLEDKFQLFPAIHRQYIYFLAKKENLDKFRLDPLLYTRQKSCGFPLVPLRIAIIGPPKSGKSVLAERFKRDLSMKVVSRGQAGRYVLTYLEFSELAKNMETVLRRGWELTNEMVAKSVEAATFDGKSITQGFVLDGFPNCIEEARHLTEVGLIPHLVLDLQAEHIDVFEFLGYCKGKRNLPVYSGKFIEHRYEEWMKSAKTFRIWFDQEYQITADIFVKPSMWGVWCASFEYAAAALSEIQQYYKLCKCDVVLRLGNMQVTPLEFIQRHSSYKNYCPCCLYFENALNCGGEPPDRTGVVQFRKFFYYICNEHIELFVDDPEKFIPPYSSCTLPPDLPLRIFPTEIPLNCYEDGVCVICYWENQPLIVITEGSLEYAVLYREKVYLFDSEECLKKFMRQPFKYYSKCINFKGAMYPSLHYKELPILGFLQQYDAKQLIKAIVNTGITRPVIPGLSIEVSGCLNVGLFLKVKNPRTPEQFIPLFKDAQNIYHEMRIELINDLAQMKKMINPYIYYDELLPPFVDPIFKNETAGPFGDAGNKNKLAGKLPLMSNKRSTATSITKLVKFGEESIRFLK